MKKPIPANYSVVNTFTADGSLYFHFGKEEKWYKKLVKFEPSSGLVTLIDLPDSFDMKNSIIHQIGQDVIQFANDDYAGLMVNRLHKLDSDSPQITYLTRIYRSTVCAFSVAVDARRYFYLTGGRNVLEVFVGSRVASMLDIKTQEEKELPELNHVRSNHSSIILDSHLFVFGGHYGAIQKTGSIESLDLRIKSVWKTLVTGNKFATRQCNCVVAVSATKLLVYGG